MVKGHRSSGVIDGSRSCRVYADLTDDTCLTLDLHGDDIRAGRWAGHFTLAKDMFTSLESWRRLAKI